MYEAKCLILFCILLNLSSRVVCDTCKQQANSWPRSAPAPTTLSCLSPTAPLKVWMLGPVSVALFMWRCSFNLTGTLRAIPSSWEYRLWYRTRFCKTTRGPGLLLDWVNLWDLMLQLNYILMCKFQHAFVQQIFLYRCLWWYLLMYTEVLWEIRLVNAVLSG